MLGPLTFNLLQMSDQCHNSHVANFAKAIAAVSIKYTTRRIAKGGRLLQRVSLA